MLLRSFWLQPPSGPREGCDEFHDFDASSSRVPAEQRRARLDVMRTRDDEWSRALQRGIESGAPDFVA